MYSHQTPVTYGVSRMENKRFLCLDLPFGLVPFGLAVIFRACCQISASKPGSVQSKKQLFLKLLLPKSCPNQTSKNQGNGSWFRNRICWWQRWWRDISYSIKKNITNLNTVISVASQSRDY